METETPRDALWSGPLTADVELAARKECLRLAVAGSGDWQGEAARMIDLALAAPPAGMSHAEAVAHRLAAMRTATGDAAAKCGSHLDAYLALAVPPALACSPQPMPPEPDPVGLRGPHGPADSASNPDTPGESPAAAVGSRGPHSPAGASTPAAADGDPPAEPAPKAKRSR